MRYIRPLIVLTFIASLAVAANAQSAVPANLEALKTLQHDLGGAMEAMKPCLPIYEGHRGISEKAVKEARAIVHAAIVAAEPPATPKPVVVEKPQPKSKSEKKPEAVKPPAKDPTAPAKPQAKEKPEVTVAQSQAGMQKGLEAIQQALKDLKTASALLPADQATKVEALLKTAADEATKSIALHAEKG